MELLFAIVGLIIALVVYGRYSNDAAKEQNRVNLERIARNSASGSEKVR